MNTNMLISILTSVQQCISRDIDEFHDEFLMIDECSDEMSNVRRLRENIEVCELCEFCDIRFTALVIVDVVLWITR